MQYDTLMQLTLTQLKTIAQENNLPIPLHAKKAELVDMILRAGVDISEAAIPPAGKRGRPKKQETAAEPLGEAVYIPPQSDDQHETISSVYIPPEPKPAAQQAVYIPPAAPATPPAQPQPSSPDEKAKPVESMSKELSETTKPGIETVELSDLEGVNPAVPNILNTGDCGTAEGILEVQSEGYGFLRALDHNQKDVYISIAQIRRFNLRNGDHIKGITRPEKKEGERYLAMLYITSINGDTPEVAAKRKSFDELTPIYPDQRLTLERLDKPDDLAIRLLDLVAPVGKGQRGLIVSPPKAGKTTILKKIASSIVANYPDVTLMVLLIDERPEEVTDMQRSIQGEVIYSTFDEQPENHCMVAEAVLDRAKRLVEHDRDVVILMDSITRLARANNQIVPTSGRLLSGGLDPGALYLPKRFFGAARNIENGGSLTILATALVDTGSRLDDIIYEEFKSTGNMELHLDRKLQERRIFPAIDFYRSGTRREEVLLSPAEMKAMWQIRKLLSGNAEDATELLIDMMTRTQNNAQFIEKLGSWLTMMESKPTFRSNGRG